MHPFYFSATIFCTLQIASNNSWSTILAKLTPSVNAYQRQTHRHKTTSYSHLVPQDTMPSHSYWPRVTWASVAERVSTTKTTWERLFLMHKNIHQFDQTAASTYVALVLARYYDLWRELFEMRDIPSGIAHCLGWQSFNKPPVLTGFSRSLPIGTTNRAAIRVVVPTAAGTKRWNIWLYCTFGLNSSSLNETIGLRYCVYTHSAIQWPHDDAKLRLWPTFSLASRSSLVFSKLRLSVADIGGEGGGCP